MTKFIVAAAALALTAGLTAFAQGDAAAPAEATSEKKVETTHKDKAGHKHSKKMKETKTEENK